MKMIIGKERIEKLLGQLFPICEMWIEEIDGLTYFVDPIDGEEISAHYGATHMAAAMILYGKMKHQQPMYDKGISLLNSIIDRWNQNKTLPAFHFDFNNFALCVIEDVVKEENSTLASRIRQIVLQTADSNHNTTNWLPMRWFVNKQRYKWTDDDKYQKICKSCRQQIEKATNVDGGIEDRMPKGLSFNLQYDVATVGVLQYLRIKGEDYDLTKELSFLLNAVAPDGDINYQGRGTNQIFAWSLWLYILATSYNEGYLAIAMDYLEPKVVVMFQRNNLMLNEWDGIDKYLWWDYHYCSVYCAHFLLWLVLALYDYGKMEIAPVKEVKANDSGLELFKTKETFVAVFSGRSEYLSEKGPVVSAIWMKKHGTIMKGTFGPWQGEFGRFYSNRTVENNWLGLIEISDYLDIYPSFIRRFLNRFKVKSVVRCLNKYYPSNVVAKSDSIIIEYINKGNNAVLNIPIFESGNSVHVGLEIDGVKTPLIEIARIKNQYGWSRILQSRPSGGYMWKLIFM